LGLATEWVKTQSVYFVFETSEEGGAILLKVGSKGLNSSRGSIGNTITAETQRRGGMPPAPPRLCGKKK